MANALQLEASLRQRYVEAQAVHDRQLMADVLSLVRSASETLTIPRSGAGGRGSGDMSNTWKPFLAEGDVLCDRFAVTGFLDAGGMGEVYSAFDRELGCGVALKTIRRGEVGVKALDRFRKEVVRARRISHQNICRVYDLFQHGQSDAGVHFLTMEMLHGSNLWKYTREHGPLPPAGAAAVLRQLADGLAAAHGRGIIHRDLKPGNVMLVVEESGIRVVITDFGLALPLTADGEELAATHRSGTPHYMAPEQRDRGLVSPAVDVYAFGLIAKAILPASSSKERIPGGRCSWAQLIARCTDPDPRKRPPTGLELRHLLTSGNRITALTLCAVAALLVAAVAPLLVRFGLTDWALRTSEPVRMTQYAGLVTAGSISLDGKLAAYASDEAEPGNLDIWLTDLAAGTSRRITTHPAEELYPEISPDNEWVAYRSEKNGGGIYASPGRGGAERLIAAGGFDPAFSPDGQRLAYWTGEPGNLSVAGSRIYLMDFPSGRPEPLHPEFSDARYPVWSPDGKSIVFLGVRESDANPDAAADWWLARPEDPRYLRQTFLKGNLRARRLVLHKGIRWWRDYFLFAATLGDATNLWYTRLGSNGRSGPILRITESTDSQLVPSAAANGRMVYSTVRAQIATLGIDLAGRAADPRIVTSSVGNDTFPSVSADGRMLAFRRRVAGVRNVWVKDIRDGRESAVTTSPTEKLQPFISPDGGSIAWSEADGERHSVFVTRLPDRSTVPLCRYCGDVQGWTPDGEDVLVASGLDGTVKTVALKTGKPSVVLQESAYLIDSARYSPDGRWIVFVGRPKTGAGIYLAPVTAARSATATAIPLVDSAAWNDAPAWSSDSSRVYYRSNRDGYYCIWSVAVPARPGGSVARSEIVRHFHSYRSHLNSVPRGAFAIGICNQQMYLTSADIRGTVWLSGILTRWNHINKALITSSNP